ncbi:MAG: rane protein-like protein [Marmoricola sp.]|nr:rane protein-like protein [Marmoricola sp.]
MVVVSGVAELLGAMGMLLRRTRRTAGVASAVLLLAVFPGNVVMALDALRDGGAVAVVLTLVRLPLQLPLIRAAWRAGRS